MLQQPCSLLFVCFYALVYEPDCFVFLGTGHTKKINIFFHVGIYIVRFDMITETICVRKTQGGIAVVTLFNMLIMKLIHKMLRHFQNAESDVNWLVQCHFTPKHFDQSQIVVDDVGALESRFRNELFGLLPFEHQVEVSAQTYVFEALTCKRQQR